MSQMIDVKTECFCLAGNDYLQAPACTHDKEAQNVSKMVLTEILSLCLLFFTSTGNKRCRAGRSATDSKHPTHLAHAFLMRNRRAVDPWVVYRSLYVCTQTQMHGTD